LETVVEGKTGWLRDVASVDEWTEVMKMVLNKMSPADLQQMGQNGRERVHEQFSRDTMAGKLSNEMEQMIKSKRSKFLERKDIVLSLWLVIAFLAALVATVIKAKYGRGDRRVTEFARARRIHTGSDEDMKFVPTAFQ